MIIPVGKTGEATALHLQKIYKTDATDAVAKTIRSDVVTISKFSALVELGRSRALAMPEIREDEVARAKLSLAAGESPSGADIASAMIGAAVEGQE